MNSKSKIHEFWKEKAEMFRTSENASWGDILMIREVSELSKHLDDYDNVLDVGCANGSSSIQFVRRKNITLTGIDYVSEMIQNARYAQKKLPKSIAKRIVFKEGNALSLDVPSNHYDKIICTRCICNLTSQDDQWKAVRQMWQALRPGGTLLLSEPTVQGLKELNKMSKHFGLKPLYAPWHNLYVDEKELLKFSKPLFSTNIDYFSGTYYFCSRIIYRWIKGDDASKLKRDSLFNKIGILLPSIGAWGVQRLYVMRKK